MKCKLKYKKLDKHGFPVNSKANPREAHLMGQDVFIYENFFPNKRDGVFIDIGAAEGVSRSNSYFFEKELGWSGICIEAQKHSYGKLIKNRNSICVNACLSDKEEEVEFSFSTGMSLTDSAQFEFGVRLWFRCRFRLCFVFVVIAVVVFVSVLVF